MPDARRYETNKSAYKLTRDPRSSLIRRAGTASGKDSYLLSVIRVPHWKRYSFIFLDVRFYLPHPRATAPLVSLFGRLLNLIWCCGASL